MEYQVPQFIEVEDKLVGPLTLKQFIYIAGSAGLCVVFFFYLNIIFAILLSIPVAGLGGALAFYKVNGKPFVEMLEAAFNYVTHAKLMIWKQEAPKSTANQETLAAPEVAARRGTPRLTRGKLSELAWSLDVKSNDASSSSARHRLPS